DGRVNTAGTGQIEDIVVLTDGDILAIGTLGENFNVTRYNSDGSIDTLFGTGGTGRVSTDFLGSDFAQDGYVQPDGKIVVAGNTGGINGDFGILRYTTAGVLDLTFSNDGKQTIDFNGTGDGAAGAAPDSQGRIVMAGSANAFTLVAVARLLGDDAGPTPTPTPTATPTATPTPGPPASIVGAVTTPSGTAVRGATVFLTDPQGVRRLNLTNSFGFYAFNDVPSGVTYTVSVKSTRFRFTAQQRLITGNTTIDIVGLE
ncbi:MAG: carboxypeptidase regulatory-like domain-containing protein, partial [Pyrinomonadaceae bacterium]